MQHKRIVAALCDGMGGMQEGAKASRMAAEIITADYKESAKLENIPLFLSGEAKKADTAVAGMKNANGARIEAGTTLTAVIIENSSLFWVSVGDSRIYIFRDHDMARATQDHNYLLTLMQRVKNGEITEAEALNDPSREALISYVGCGKVSLIDYNSAPFELQSGDVILMCSDGLYRSLSDDRIKEIIYSSKSDPELVSHVLTASALDNSNGSQDNTSVILIYYY
jgi:protein phosphatase